MADTHILPAVNASVEGIRAEVQGVRGEVQAGFKHLNERLDKLHDGNVESARWMGVQEQKVTAAHRRIDEIKDEVIAARHAADEAGGPGVKGWAGIIIAFGAAVAGIIAAIKQQEPKVHVAPSAAQGEGDRK